MSILVRTVLPFSRALGCIRTFVITHSFRFSIITISAISALKRRDGAARSTETSDDCQNGTGILTCFPFGVLELRYVLGPTNPRLTNIAEETWPLRRQGFSPCYAATITRIFVCERSTGLHSPASARTQRLPTRLPCGTPWYRWST